MSQRIRYTVKRLDGTKISEQLDSSQIIGRSSTVKSASALIYEGKVLMLGIKGTTDGINALTLSVYNALTATGDIWDTWVIPATDRFGGGFYPAPMYMENGIYVTSSGGTHTYTVFYAEILSFS